MYIRIPLPIDQVLNTNDELDTVYNAREPIFMHYVKALNICKGFKTATCRYMAPFLCVLLCGRCQLACSFGSC